MGISRSSHHKRRATGARKNRICMKRKFELGRPPSMTRLMGPKRIRVVRTMGGNRKFRALRLETGNFSWASEGISRKTRLIDVVYNASNNELVRTKTLVKNAVITIDATPFKSWYESHYGVHLGKKKATDEDKTFSKAAQKKHAKRKKYQKIDPKLEEQFNAGRLYACIASRPGQSGRCDGYILEGKELEFYLKKLRAKR
uniref:40S ribosomal protein S8 n=1 Tax=Salpingoeca llamariensis TaxID=2822280 RepID=A0A8E6YKY7_9EUKA|nr:40S ribosomal protein S8 [Salpingoeca llamariensis]